MHINAELTEEQTQALFDLVDGAICDARQNAEGSLQLFLDLSTALGF